MNNINSILKNYPPKDAGNLIPILQAVQQQEGYISAEAVKIIAKWLNVSKSHIYGVATFYNQFKFKPPAKYNIKVCLGTACHVRGGPAINNEFELQLGIKAGETTEDKNFALETVNCVGACALGPIVIVNEEYYGKMIRKEVSSLIKKLLKNE